MIVQHSVLRIEINTDKNGLRVHLLIIYIHKHAHINNILCITIIMKQKKAINLKVEMGI